jgi:transcriptional regulator with XRE-family HTH domain
MHYAQAGRKCLLHSLACYGDFMESAGERLKQARIKAGFASAAAAAEAMGVKEATYAQHENGLRGYPAMRAERYARRFKVEACWLLYGRDSKEPVFTPSEADLEKMLEIVVREMPMGVKIGDLPRLAAPSLHEQLGLYRAGGSSREKGKGIARGKSSRSPPATKPDA